ncbi:MAG: amino acid adenylation domain-containing protein [Cycloclasticus sp.]|jgi:amino acid adenylation domain
MYQQQGLALSPQQKRILQLHDNKGANNAEYVQLTIGLTGHLAQVRLKSALEQVMLTHEIFRTAFRTQPGLKYPYQYVLDKGPELPWGYHDFSQSEDSKAELLRLQQEQASTVFELIQGKVLGAALTKISENEHQLVITLSALVADQFSLDKLTGLLGQTYHRLVEGEYFNSDNLSDDTTQYTQFSEWLTELQDDEDATQYLAYWQELELDAVPQLVLPYRLNPPAGSQFFKTSLSQKLDDESWRKLQKLAVSKNVNLPSLLGACWSSLLSRIGGQENYLMAWQHDCRHDYEELADGLGHFAKALPLHVSITPQTAFASWVNTLENQLEQHLDAQEYWPADQTVITNHTTAAFEYRQISPSYQAGDVRFTVEKCIESCDDSEIKLTASAKKCPQGDSLELLVNYRVSRYSKVAIERLLDQLVTLLKGLPETYHQSIGGLSIVSQQERESLLDWQGETLDMGPHALIHIIEEQARLKPHAVALANGVETYSYEELNHKANKLANYLIAKGVSIDAAVAILLPRGPQSVVVILAIWKAGACYVPLDVGWPQDRINAVLSDADAKAVVTLAGVDVSDDTPRVDLDTLDLGAVNNESPQTTIQLNQVAYILYTSGSTGAPKGVVVEHRQLLNYVLGVSESLILHENRHFALTSTLAADLGNTLLFGALAYGGTLHVMTLEQVTDANGFAEYMEKYPLDAIKLVPSHLEALLSADRPERVLPRKTLVLGGEATSLSLLTRIRALAPELDIFNHYGPTETTVGVLVHSLKADALLHGDTLPLTRPLPNTRIFLLDAKQQLVATGEKGEVFVGGDNVTRGYLHDADATEKAYLTLADYGQGPMYRTGDIARYLPEGGIELVGRADHQVKVRGFRLELGDVEVALSKLPEVKQAVVTSWGEGTALQLCGYLLPADMEASQPKLDLDAVRTRLGELLPDYMVPARLFSLDFLPLLASGKVDRKALPDPGSRERNQEYVAPRGELEQKLADIWQQLLPVERVGRLDNFFGLGGHSLLAVSLMARVKKELNLALPIKLIFQYSNIAQLADYIRQEQVPVSTLQTLTARKADSTLYCIHGGGGHVHHYQNFADALGDTCSVVGVQSRELIEQNYMPTSLQDMIDDYTSQIISHSKGQSIHLLGWSNGSFIAIGIVEKLKRLGLEVASLFLVDGTMTHVLERDFVPWEFCLENYAPLRSLPMAHKQDLKITFETKNHRQAVAELLDYVNENALLQEDVCVEQVTQDLLTALDSDFLLSAYSLPEITMDFSLFLASDRDNSRNVALWQDYAKALAETYSIDANHYSILESNTLIEVVRRNLLGSFQAVEQQEKI